MLPAKLRNTLQLLPKNQELLIETVTNEILVGNLKSIDLNCNILEIQNVRDIKTNVAYNTAQILYLKQIKRLQILEDEKNPNEKPQTAKHNEIFSNVQIKTNSMPIRVARHKQKRVSSSPSDNSSQSCSSSTTNNLELIEDNFGSALSLSSSSLENECIKNLPTKHRMSNLEIDQLNQLMNNYCYIKQTDTKYHEALEDLRSHAVVGLLMLPHDAGRHQKASIIAMATSQNTYLFDMQALGKIPNDLKALLNANRPRKAVHYSHFVQDHLHNCQNSNLNGVFDTFVAYCIVTGNKQHLSLEEIIEKCFDMPSNYFEKCQEVHNYSRVLDLNLLIIF